MDIYLIPGHNKRARAKGRIIAQAVGDFPILAICHPRKNIWHQI